MCGSRMSKSKRREARLAKKAAREAKNADERADKSPNGKSNDDTDTDKDLKEVKLQKALAKGQYSRSKNRLLLLLEDPDASPEDISERTEKVRANFSKFIDHVVALLQIAKDEEISADIEKFENEISKAEDELSQLLQRVDTKLEHYFDIHEEIEEVRESSRGRTQERDRSQSPRSELILRSRSGRGQIQTRQSRDLYETRSLSSSSVISRVAEETRSVRSRVADETRSERSRVVDETKSVRSRLNSSKQNEIENIENAKQELEELYRRRHDDLDARMRELKLANLSNRASQNEASLFQNQLPTPRADNLIPTTPNEFRRIGRESPTEWINHETERRDHQMEDGLGMDLLKQLKRVPIPIFSGDKRTYASWKAAFYSCVDAANVTPEYKLLQLRCYLRGEALKSIELFGHSAEAYEASKRQLERKFGGERRTNRYTFRS